MRPASGFIYAVTGCAHAEMASGLRLFASDYAVLYPEREESAEPSSCVMTMPAGFEANFVKSGPKEFENGNVSGDNMSRFAVENAKRQKPHPGMIRITIDNSFSHPSSGTSYFQ